MILPPLLFVLGKGGVGRSTVAVSFADALAKQNKKVLVVQWTLEDAISTWFGKEPATHSAKEVEKDIFVMNFSADDAIREYFVDHLKMKMLYKLVIENRHVQRLIQAAPGIQELFFLGRLYWLVELAQRERGWSYDHVIIDSPATGHSTSLFQIAETMASFGFTGPLATECERVARLLADEKKTGTVVVTIPEELPVEEVSEFIPKLTKELKRPPLALIVNRAVKKSLGEKSLLAASGEIEKGKFSDGFWRSVKLVFNELRQKIHFEDLLHKNLTSSTKLGCYFLPEQLLENPLCSDRDVVRNLSRELSQMLGAPA